MQLRDTSTFSTLFKYERMKINKLPTYIKVGRYDMFFGNESCLKRYIYLYIQ